MPKMSKEQFREFCSRMVGCLPTDLDSAAGQYWIDHPAALRDVLKNPPVLSAAVKSASRHEHEHVRFYREVFGLTVNWTNVIFPPETEGFGWTLVIAKELGDKPLATAMAACRKLFMGKVYQYADNLDNAVPTNDRTPINGSYAISVRDRMEADEENKNLSANDIKSRQMATMTLLERIVLELFYFWKTGKHLDIQNWTFCSGSRSFGGRVPICGWFGGKFKIDWWNSSSRSDDNLRSREVIV